MEIGLAVASDHVGPDVRAVYVEVPNVNGLSIIVSKISPFLKYLLRGTCPRCGLWIWVSSSALARQK